MCVPIQVGLDLMRQAPQQAVRDKSVALGCLFKRLMEQECSEWGFRLASPPDASQRGSQISFAHPEGYAIMQVVRISPFHLPRPLYACT